MCGLPDGLLQTNTLPLDFQTHHEQLCVAQESDLSASEAQESRA